MAELFWKDCSAAEAALIAGVEERDIHRLADERLLPEMLRANRKNCRFSPIECVLGSFYIREQNALTKDDFWQKNNDSTIFRLIDWSVSIDKVAKIH